MRKLMQFIRAYKLFALVLDGGLIALALDLFGYDKAAHFLIISLCAFALVPLLHKMWQDVRHGTYGVDILAATAIITALVMQEYWAAIVIVLMLTGGEALEDYAERRAKKELDDLLKRKPQQAHLVKSRGKIVDVRVSQVTVGDKLEIRPGEVVPVDAFILEGEADFDESNLTGESLPQAKGPEDTILSGAVNINGLLLVRAAHTAEDSQYQQIIKLVESAANSQAPFVRMADRYSIPFTIFAFALAGGAWAWSGDSLRFLQVLVVATPCPLILAAPIAVISGTSRAAKQGIIIKTGSALERLAAVKTMAFDKTGTLTEGILQVAEIRTFNGFTKSEVAALAGSVEQSSNHLIAQAVVAHATHKNIKLPKVKQARETAGRGVIATVQGKKITVGRLTFLKDHDIELPGNLAKSKETAVFVAVGTKFAGVITFTDSVRPLSQSTIKRLKKLGIKDLVMITGDNEDAAQKVAKKLGINTVVADALPSDKLLAVEKLAQRPVAFIGDGVNDAPVLMASDVGIALGARGSTAASESADIVIMLDDISYVATATEISKRTFKIARQSILIGIALSVALMLVFATGKFKPLYGALLQELVDIVVIVNALRAHGSFRKPKLKLSAGRTRRT